MVQNSLLAPALLFSMVDPILLDLNIYFFPLVCFLLWSSLDVRLICVFLLQKRKQVLKVNCVLGINIHLSFRIQRYKNY